MLNFPLPPGRDVRTVIDDEPFLFPSSPTQRISVVLNGAVVDELVLTPARQQYSLVLPAANRREGGDVLEFPLAYARRPQEVKAEPDTRTFAVSWFGIDFTEVAP